MREPAIQIPIAMAPEVRNKQLPSVKPRAWDALTPELTTWIIDAVSSMGFGQPTPVQASCIPLFMGNKDVVVEVGYGVSRCISAELMVIRP